MQMVMPMTEKVVQKDEIENVFQSTDRTAYPFYGPLNVAFNRTSEILLGKRLTNLQSYRDWLLEYVGESVRTKSAVSDKTIYVPDILFFKAIKKNMVTLEESIELAKKQISESDARSITLSNASEKLEDVKFVTSDVMLGQNLDLRETSTCMHAQHCLDGYWYIYSKCDAYCAWPRETEYSFGCYFLFASKFCMKCHNSVALTRCFEVSDSTNCTDCYFCHNCEALSNCMFCFNVKSMRYAIGNVEVGREKFMEIKTRLLGQVADELEKNKRLDISIYNFGCWKK